MTVPYPEREKTNRKAAPFKPAPRTLTWTGWPPFSSSDSESAKVKSSLKTARQNLPVSFSQSPSGTSGSSSRD